MPAAEVDVAIVGAGPVGATAAALAAREGLSLAVFEARESPSTDIRILALSHASRETLEEVGAWPAAHATPIHSIHISQRGGPGRTVIEAAEQRIPALGYTVPYSALDAALGESLKRTSIPVHFSRSCTGIELDAERAVLRFASGDEVHARLLVLADGGANAKRIPGVAFEEKDYGQRAIVAPVGVDRAHGHRAYERFTPEGPMALLPVGERFALVWTAPPERAERILGLGDDAFLQELQAAFGDRAGRFVTVGERNAFPLRLRAVNTPVAMRTVLVGNAAQALHPIAGQGLNLGLRDAAQLAAMIRATRIDELGSAAMLAGYREARRRDSSRGVAFTDFLVSSFADARTLPTWGRGLALAALDLVPGARRALAARMIRGAPGP